MSTLDRREPSKFTYALSDHKKTMKKRKYVKVDYETRTKLIVRVLFENRSIRKAAKEMGLNFSTAKAIIKIFREEGRILKKAEQGEYDPSYRTFEKSVYKLFHQKNKAGEKKGKENEGPSLPSKILTDLKALIQDKSKTKPPTQTEPPSALPHVEDTPALKNLPETKGFQPFHKVASIPTTTTSHDPPSNTNLPPSQMPPMNIKDFVLMNTMKQRLQAEIQNQILLKTMALLQSRAPQLVNQPLYQPLLQGGPLPPFQAMQLPFGNLPTNNKQV